MIERFARKASLHHQNLANMKPQSPDNSAGLFRSQLSQILNLSHLLVRLSVKMNGENLRLALMLLTAKVLASLRYPLVLLVDLHCLKYIFNESD